MTCARGCLCQVESCSEGVNLARSNDPLPLKAREVVVVDRSPQSARKKASGHMHAVLCCVSVSLSVGVPWPVRQVDVSYVSESVGRGR